MGMLPETTTTDTTLQQPRDDLQSAGTTQQETQPLQTPTAVSQDNLTVPQLRVGDTTTVVGNNTSIPATRPAPDYWNAAWLWMIVPIALALILFWPQKKTKKTKVAGVPVLDMEAVERANLAARKKSKKKAKR